MERATGFEPATSCLASRRSTAELCPHTLVREVGLEPTRATRPSDSKSDASANSATLAGDPGGIRTRGPLIKSQVLYLLSYRVSACVLYHFQRFFPLGGGGGTRTHKGTGPTGFRDRLLSQFGHASNRALLCHSMALKFK